MSPAGKGGGPTRLGGSGSDSGAGSSSGLPAASSSADLAASSSASMSMAEDSSMIGEVLDGRYKIVKKLGEGGMGEVYAAEHVHIAKKVAIKLLRKEVVSNEEAVSRFRQEARSASTIGHRNIIGIDDFGQLKDGRIYLCMEFLNGAPLNDMIMEPQPTERLLNILIQTGHGLAAAHAKGIVHRDMKPENIFVTTTPQGEDIPKLLDFGIAKVGGQDGSNNLTKTGTIFGTPYYMAPEQALGQNVDARVDIYALGVICYEVFSGSLPFSGESFMGVLTQHITTDPEPVAQRAAKAGKTLPAGLPELIARAMAKDPDRRFRTMDEMVNGLVGVYRNLAGPGMSSYMEAAPRAGASSAAQPIMGPPQMPGRGAPTAGAGSGMMATAPAASMATLAAPGAAASMATLAAPGAIGSDPARAPVGPVATPPSGPHASAPYIPPSGPHGAVPPGPQGMPPHGYPGGPGGPPPGYPGAPYAGQSSAYPMNAGSSGMYAGDSGMVAPPKKGKAALIAIVIAAVVVIGGVLAIVLVPRGKKDDAAVAIDASTGVAVTGIDAAAGGPDVAVVDAAEVAMAIDAGVVEPAIDAASGVTPAGNTVVVLIHSSTRTAVVYDNGTKLGVVPQTVMVAPGEEHAVVLKASGFEDAELTVDGREPRYDVKLKKLAGSGPGTGHGSGPGTGHGSGPGTGAGSGSGSGSGSGHKPPPGPDCDNNPTDPRCGL